MSLFRGAAILAGVRARAAAGNASAANAHAAGTLVETLATRALSVAGCVPGRRSARGGGGSGTTASAPPAPFGASGLEPSPRAAALLQRLRRFMAEHALPAEAALEAHAASDARWSVSPEGRAPQGAGPAAGLWNLWLPADSRELLKINAPAGANRKRAPAGPRPE